MAACRYEQFVKRFETKLNLLKLVRFASAAAAQLESELAPFALS